MVKRRRGRGGGVVVGAGVGEQGGDGAGGVVGEAGPDGDLVKVAAVQGLDVERGEQGLFYPVGRIRQDSSDGGELVEQGGVVVRRGGVVEGFELGFGTGGGELGDEQVGAVVAEDVLVEEPFQGAHDGGFGDGDRAVVGVGGGLA